MKHPRLIAPHAAALTLLMLGGCGGSDTAERPAPMAPEETVFGGQIQQMDRVREETSKLSSERMDTLNRQIEGAEGKEQ